MNGTSTNNITDQSIEELSYEEALQRLETIIRELEKEGISLNDSIALFERGQMLSRQCSKLIDQAELKIQQLIDGELIDFTSNELSSH